MNARLLLPLATLITSAAFAADLPPIPTEPIAKKKELLFSDDFSAPTLAKVWHPAVPTFALEDGQLKGTQTRDKNIPAADGKPEVKAHAAVHGLSIPTKDSIVEVKMRLQGATMMDVEFDDRAYTGSHYGHLCRAQLKLNGVTIMDEREGSQNEALKAMLADPSKKAEHDRLMAGKSVTYPFTAEAGKTYTFVVETVGEEMRVTIDGKPVAYLKSPGIGHPTKSQIEIGVAGRDGYFDDIKVWNAEPAK